MLFHHFLVIKVQFYVLKNIPISVIFSNILNIQIKCFLDVLSQMQLGVMCVCMCVFPLTH